MSQLIDDLPWNDPLLLDEDGLVQENEALRVRLEEAQQLNDKLYELMES